MTEKTRERIEAENKANIEKIRKRHHEKGEINHKEYHQLLNKESERVDAELVTGGYIDSAPAIEEKTLRDEIKVIKARVEALEEKV